MGYFLNAEEVARLEQLLAAGDKNEVIAVELGVSAAAIAYRRKKYNERNGALPCPLTVRLEARAKIAAAMRGNRNRLNRGSVLQLTRKRNCSLCCGRFTTADPAQHKCESCRTTTGPLHTKGCICCGATYETDQPKNQHKCDRCRAAAANGEHDDMFGNFVLYG